MNYILANISLQDAPNKVQDMRDNGYAFALSFMSQFKNQGGEDTGDWMCMRAAGALPPDDAIDPPGVVYRQSEEGWSCSRGQPALPNFLLDSLLNYFRNLEGQYWS